MPKKCKHVTYRASVARVQMGTIEKVLRLSRSPYLKLILRQERRKRLGT